MRSAFRKLYRPLKKFYGKWRVLGDRSYRSVLCECACGTRSFIKLGALREGRSKCCIMCRQASVGLKRRTHYKTRTTEYHIWTSMKSRCLNVKNESYERYGGRGIEVCQRWRSSFQAFLSDIGNRPSNKHSLERINNNGHYEPGNVRWATMKEQARNRGNTIKYNIDGEDLLLVDLVEKHGLRYDTLNKRLESGFGIKEALSLPRFYKGISMKERRRLRKNFGP